MIGMPLLALRRDNGRERLRVILPRICRLPRPADNCHSNKYPLWVSAIDENARSLRPDDWRVNPCKEVCREMLGMFRKGSEIRFFLAIRAPSLASQLPQGSPVNTNFVSNTDPVGAGLPAMAVYQEIAEFSWQSPTTDPPSTDALGACHAHTTSRRSRRRESATPTAMCRSDHGWPGRSPACTDRPCSARR